MLHSNKRQIATHKCVSLTDIIASQRTRYQRAHMIPFMHISNKLNESMVLEIRIVVTLLGTVLIEKGLRGTSMVLPITPLFTVQFITELQNDLCTFWYMLLFNKKFTKSKWF